MRQIALARRTGQALDRTEPKATKAYYDNEMNRVVIEFENGSLLCIPSALIQGIADAPGEVIADLVLSSTGTALRWEKLDVDLGVAGLVSGVFGTRAWMTELASRGGRAKSPLKAAAARTNGRKGGRPRTLTAGAHVPPVKQPSQTVLQNPDQTPPRSATPEARSQKRKSRQRVTPK
ncbi:MAG: DUF2442 domain-containing protein [Acidobacteriota bacterium]